MTDTEETIDMLCAVIERLVTVAEQSVDRLVMQGIDMSVVGLRAGAHAQREADRVVDEGEAT